MFRPRSLVVAIFVVGLGASSLSAGDLRIPLPKKSKYTPVQKLNRDGVAAVEKHQYDKAKKLFYKAYLIDPNDPFTLNNLGYISELEGDIERIKGQRRYYEGRSAYSSINVTLTPEVVPAEPTPRPTWMPAKTFERATRAMTELWQGGADGLIWLAVLLGPFVVVLAALAALVGTLWRRRMKRVIGN
jgi:tetratricopeptide (TPR) repeat protein